MAKGGYVGKILVLDLAARKTSELDTAKYEEWGGGHGMGTAIFFDLCKDKTVDGFDPANVVTLMSSPFSGTLVPSASGRTEVTGIGIQAYPTGWYTRSNVGGRFAGMMKFAGYDGIVITGKADKPVWVNIINDKVVFEDAADLWGLDTHDTQEKIWAKVTGVADVRDWWQFDAKRDGGRTTQKPTVMCIGPAGENKNRNACLITDAGNAAGQGGFGGVWGAKNLKAVSVVGSGSVPVADPKTLLDLRQELQNDYAYNVDNPVFESPAPDFPFYGIVTTQPGSSPVLWTQKGGGESRAQGCMGCYRNCRKNWASGVANGDACAESCYYLADPSQPDQQKATELLDRMGINSYDLSHHGYLLTLFKKGVLGRGKAIESSLPFEKYGTYEFIEAFTKAVAYGTDIGKDLADGLTRAAVKWGRWKEDTKSGILPRPNWGFAEHYDPRIEVEWSYGSILGDRDINEHGINTHVHWMPTVAGMAGQAPLATAEEVTKILADRTGLGDPAGWDYSATGVYGDAKIKAVAWHRHYSRFWIQSMGMCDTAWPMLINYGRKDHVGATPDFEPRLYTAVTGNKLTYEESLELGRKIWNLDKAIWVLQGRHRDQEVHADYVYDKPTDAPYALPIIENGAWTYSQNLGRTLDRAKWEDVKTRFFTLEGWDTKTGWPTRTGLSSLGLATVADELEKAGKLGAEG